jgi:hypothetical protein
MLKKNYIQFAKLLASQENKDKNFDNLVSEIADIFEDDNPNFDRDRFFNAVYHPEK